MDKLSLLFSGFVKIDMTEIMDVVEETKLSLKDTLPLK